MYEFNKYYPHNTTLTFRLLVLASAMPPFSAKGTVAEPCSKFAARVNDIGYEKSA